MIEAATFLVKYPSSTPNFSVALSVRKARYRASELFFCRLELFDSALYLASGELLNFHATNGHKERCYLLFNLYSVLSLTVSLDSRNISNSLRTLKRIEFHRLLALIEEDVRRYPRSRIGEIHARVGIEIPRSPIARALKDLRTQNKLRMEGARRRSVYFVHD